MPGPTPTCEPISEDWSLVSRRRPASLARAKTDAVVLETISYIETLTTELSSKIWQKISLLPRAAEPK